MKKIFPCCVVLFLLIILISCKKTALNHDLLQKRIVAGLSFLKDKQYDYGEFKVFASAEPDMQRNYYPDSSVFATTFVLYSLSFCPENQTKGMVKKGLSFLKNEMIYSGIWKFFSSRNRNIVKPDLDDTACVSFILKKYKIPYPENKEVFYNNRNSKGLFYTWLLNKSDRRNDVDCAVNANILLYLRDRQQTMATCDWLNDLIVSSKDENCSIYYPDRLVLYYLVSRAWYNGVKCLQPSVNSIIKRTAKFQEFFGNYGNELQTALAINTLLNFNSLNNQAAKSINWLLKRQNKDGSWAKSIFFVGPNRYFGSEELTTAFCIEALCRYDQISTTRGK